MTTVPETASVEILFWIIVLLVFGAVALAWYGGKIS